VVQPESRLTFDIKKDSSLPLEMTPGGFVIPNEVRILAKLNRYPDDDA
jgi:hypothetical protein